MIDAGDYTLLFNFGVNLDRACGEYGSVIIEYSDSSCLVIGKHKKYYAETIRDNHRPDGIQITYTGSKCLKNEKRKMKTHFRLLCSLIETDFVVVDQTDCELTLEKESIIGCGKSLDDNGPIYAFILYYIFSGVSLIAMFVGFLLFDKLIEDDQEITVIPVWMEMKTIIRKGKKVIFRSNSDKYEYV